jgi:hypothetical protein
MFEDSDTGLELLLLFFIFISKRGEVKKGLGNDTTMLNVNDLLRARKRR